MVKLKRVGVWSAAKVTGILYCAFGLIFGGIIALFSLFGSFMGGAMSGVSSSEPEAFLGILFGAGAVVFLPIFYGVIGLLGGALSAFLYNLVAGWFGGIELELSGLRAPAASVAEPLGDL
jgi:hypothetical protein